MKMINKNDQLAGDITIELQKLNDFQALTTPLVQKESEQHILQEITRILSSLWDKFVWFIALRSEESEDCLKVYGLHPDGHASDEFQEFLKKIIFPTEKVSG